MLPLAVLLCLMPFSIAAFNNLTCGDIYYPPSLQPATDRFTIVTAGLTGTGKSTLVDMLAGGHQMATVGTVNGDSETEQACIYHFQFMGGANPQAGHEQWRVLDTPGFDDTGGEFKMMSNDLVVEQALRNAGSVDALVLTWKYDEKFTDANLGAFIELRSMFNASVWNRLVIMYTFWQWEDCVEFLCRCNKQSDLAKVHQQTMHAAFRHINRLAGDIRCNSTVKSDCFPEAKDIPFIGGDLTLANLKRMRNVGCDPLTQQLESAQCTETCPVDSAGEIRRLRSILQKMTGASAYRTLSTKHLTNYWASCKSAIHDLQLVSSNCTDACRGPDSFAHDAAMKLQQCIYGGIASETTKVAAFLQGRFELQVWIAFFMTEKKYIATPFFSPGTAELVSKYPNYLTYRVCMMAADLNTQDAAALTDLITACWTGLASAEGIPRKPLFNNSIAILMASYKSRSYNLRMAVSLNMMHCQLPHMGCPGAQFVMNVSSGQEVKALTAWSEIASGGRCCHRQGQTWDPQTGMCNNSNVVWNQRTIDCLWYCSLSELKIPGCSVKSDGEVSCPLKDVSGKTSLAKGVFLTDSKIVNGFVHPGEELTLHFDLKDQVPFVMRTAATQTVECYQGTWQSAILWVLPSARQVRNCSVCKTNSECPSAGCMSGKGLRNQLWLAGDSVDSELCDEPHVCGAQRDATCVKPPMCSSAQGFRNKDCSKNSCSSDDCCQKLGTCDNVCHCPMRAANEQPKFCNGTSCSIQECCETDPTVETCSRATGGLCALRSCESWRGPTECVHRGLLQWDCQCKPGSCARDWGRKTGWCSDKCHEPSGCSPDTGGYCDKTMAALGINTCASWRGDTYCWAGRCICSNKVCATAYSEDHGNCNGQTAEQVGFGLAATSSRYRPELITALFAAFLAGLMTTASCVLLASRRSSRSRSEFADPLLRGEVLEEVQ